MSNNTLKSANPFSGVRTKKDNVPNIFGAGDRVRATIKDAEAAETLNFERTQSQSLPKTDQVKYHFEDAKIVDESDSADSHTYTLDDGRVLIYSKNGDGTLQLSQILNKSPEGFTTSIETYDESGNLLTVKKYQYDESNRISIIETHDKVANTITKEQITENGKNIKVTDANNGRLLSLATIDENGVELARQYFAYDASGNVKAISVYDSRKNEARTDFYENNEVVTSFPFALNLSGSTGDLESYYDYSHTTRLAEDLSNLLSESEIADINKTIAETVDRAGRGTGDAVAAVAVTLITELQKKGIVLPYYYGGGHADFELGVNGNLGSDVDPSGDQKRYKKSFDCSGFVRWCIEMAGINCPSTGADGYIGYGTTVNSVDDLTAGSLLANNQHVVMVINTYTDKEGNTHVICAESTGDFAKEAHYDPEKYTSTSADHEGGVIITDKTLSNISGYVKVDMKSYYQGNRK